MPQFVNSDFPGFSRSDNERRKVTLRYELLLNFLKCWKFIKLLLCGVNLRSKSTCLKIRKSQISLRCHIFRLHNWLLWWHQMVQQSTIHTSLMPSPFHSDGRLWLDDCKALHSSSITSWTSSERLDPPESSPICLNFSSNRERLFFSRSTQRWGYREYRYMIILIVSKPVSREQWWQLMGLN